METDRFLARLGEAPGIAAWSVHAVASRRLALGTKDGETGNPHAPMALANSLVVDWRVVLRDGRVSRGSADRSGIPGGEDGWLEEIERVATDDPDAVDVAPGAAMPEVPLRDPSVERVVEGALDPVHDWLDSIRARLREGEARTWSGAFHASVATARIATSCGLDAAAATTHLAWHVVFDGEAACGRASRSLDAIEDVPARLDRAIAYGRALADSTSLRGGADLPVLIHPDVVEIWILPALLKNLSGRAVDRGESAFDAEAFRTRRRVLGESLRLTLEPLRPLRSGSYRFTAEGIPARPVTLIEEGRLLSPVLDLKHARRLGLPPTPVAQGTDTAVIGGPPVLAEADAMRSAEGGLLVLRVLGVHTLDATSGDFSLAAPQSLRIGRGRASGRVRATIVGNLFESLRDQRLRLVPFEGETQPGLLLFCRVDPG